MDAKDFEALGLYDPDAADAALRLELLRYLVGLGASAEDLVAYRGRLAGLALVVALRGGRGLTLAEVAERSSLDVAKVLEFTRAAGFPTPGPTDRVFSDGFVALGSGLTAAEAVFGHEVVLQLVRVMGAAMARLADALVSAFLVNVEPAARREDPVGLGIARANTQAAAILPVVAPALDALLRQHILAAQRTTLGDAGEVGYETQELCVGFVDLVGSTTVAERSSIAELGALLSEFERLASDVVIEAGGRVVKLIGDEVLFTTADPSIGCSVAVRLIRIMRDHPGLPPARAGLASGWVMLRDGDVFGPVVNLAARVVGEAGPSQVVVPAALAANLGLPAVPLGSRHLKGFAAAIELVRLEEPTTGTKPAG
jgi:class 3 adenylate cyclase